MGLEILSKKNGLILILASFFALYQFSKHRTGSTNTGSYQLDKTKKILTKTLDLWKYEIIDGKNNREETLLLILSRESKTESKRPVVLAEIVADKRLERRRSQKRSGPNGRNRGGNGNGGRPGRQGRQGRQEYDPRARRRKSSGSRKSGGGSNYYGGSSQRRNGRRSNGKRNGKNGGRMTTYDGPPLLHLKVYDSVMEPLRLMLETQGFIELTPVAAAASGDSSTVATKSKPLPNVATSTRTKAEEKAVTAQELLKRERKEKLRVEEETSKVQEQEKKRNEEKRKKEREEHKKQQKQDNPQRKEESEL